ncbi:MAG: hypothetical protein Q4B63_07740 [Clostridium perfringens]|nr:hypothetical protein [Clostridium perfringens]
MSIKKIIIPIVVAAVVACGVGYYSYTTVKATSSPNTTENSSETGSSKTSSTIESTGVNANDSSSKAVSTVSNTTSEGATNSTSAPNEASSTAKANNDSTTTSNSSKSATSTSVGTTNSTGTAKSTSSTTSTTDSGTITYSVPSNMFTSSVIVVKNTTGKAISEAQLDEYLRSWIIVGQNGCSSICDADGTYWSEPWLNKVSQETLYQAFVNANGESALSQNITANEFIKATEELDRLTANDVPFTLSQAKALILNMLQEDGYATPSEVTKIVFVQETQGPSVYEVYTKESGNYIYWTVYANSGYAHG